MAVGHTTLHPGIDPRMVRGLWNRQIDRYPDTARRYGLLGIVVLATIVLYYELYVNGAVAPSILQGYGISFDYYVLILVFGNAFGAVGSLVAGLADRWGRANIVAYGLLATALLTLFALPNANSGFQYGVFYTLLAIVEGMVLVATPALVRDFSPQIGRASAMGFWTLGPVLGSLIVSQVANHSFTTPPPGVAGDWQGQYRICGIVSLIVAAIAFVVLRELSPKLRDQVMVSMRDRALVEARARSMPEEKAGVQHWASVARPRVIGAAFGVSMFLIVYYTAVAFAVIYLTTVFGFSTPDANGILNWWWGVEAAALIVIGIASDRLLVRKPFAVAGGVGSILMTLVLINRTGHADTGYYTLVVIVSLLAFFISLSFAPWMAAFTESVERLNPAAIATGLAIWGLVLRTVVSLSFLVVPHAIGSVTPIVDYGAVVQADLQNQKVAAALPIISAHPALFAELAQFPPGQIPAAELGKAVAALGGGAAALGQLSTVGAATADPVAGPKLQYVIAHGTDVQTAQANAPAEWQHWLWLCVAGQVVFLPLVLVLTGRWSPARARQDEKDHEESVKRDMAAMGLGGG